MSSSRQEPLSDMDIIIKDAVAKIFWAKVRPKSIT
jgi:hypothetical protein